MRMKRCSGRRAALAIIVMAALSWPSTRTLLAEGTPVNASGRELIVRAARVLDVRTGTYIHGAAIWIEDERVKSVGPAADVLQQAPTSARTIDLGEATVLPGLIDCHTHLMARIPEGPNGYGVNLLTKSEAFRALEGAANARATLDDLAHKPMREALDSLDIQQIVGLSVGSRPIGLS